VFAAGDLEQGDLEEAFNAAEAVGDDRLQRQAGQGVNPDSFTHGSSEQRRHWFDTGYESGDPARCDAFSLDEV
jgi:predicted metalloprotease